MRGSSSDSKVETIPESVVRHLDYQLTIDGLISNDIPGIILLVEKTESRFLGSAGVSNLDSQLPMQVGDIMPTASTGKKMIALFAIQ